MSSLYLSEVHSINLVKWIQRAKILQTDTRMRTEEQMASQIGGENTEQSDIKRRQRRGKYLSGWVKEGEEKGRAYEWKGEFAGVRHRRGRFSEGKQPVQMTGCGSCCLWLSDVKPRCFPLELAVITCSKTSAFRIIHRLDITLGTRATGTTRCIDKKQQRTSNIHCNRAVSCTVCYFNGDIT